MSRTNISTLRKHLWLSGGPCLIGEGHERLPLTDFSIDAAGKSSDETLRAFMHRLLKVHDIVAPEDCSQSVKRPVKRGVNGA